MALIIFSQREPGEVVCVWPGKKGLSKKETIPDSFPTAKGVVKELYRSTQKEKLGNHFNSREKVGKRGTRIFFTPPPWRNGNKKHEQREFLLVGKSEYPPPFNTDWEKGRANVIPQVAGFDA